MVLRKLFGNSQIQKFIRNLNYQSPDVATCQGAIDSFNRKNPMLGAIGGYKKAFVVGASGGLEDKLRPLKILQEQLSKAKEKEMTIRAQAALELGKLNDLTSVEPLITALKDKYPLVRSNAAMALGNIGDNRAIEVLSNLEREDANESVRSTAKQALEAIKKHVN